MGFDFDDVSDLGTEDDDEAAETNRRGYTPDDEDGGADPTMKPVTVYEAYMKMDVEGTGVARMYALILAGAGKKLLRHDLTDYVPFAVFEVDPEPHAFFGRSLVDLLIEDQDAATSSGHRGRADGRRRGMQTMMQSQQQTQEKNQTIEWLRSVVRVTPCKSSCHATMLVAYCGTLRAVSFI